MSSKSSHSGLKRARKKKVKIWWKIPDLDTIPTNEAREIIYRSMVVASMAFQEYHNTKEEPDFFRTFWIMTEADNMPGMLNFIIRQMNDERIKYFAEVK